MNSKVPSAPVVSLFGRSTTPTATPSSGSPVPASVTVPLTVPKPAHDCQDRLVGIDEAVTVGVVLTRYALVDGGVHQDLLDGLDDPGRGSRRT